MLTLSIEVDPLEFPSGRELRIATDSALKIWVSYFKRRVDERFKGGGPGWLPRKASDTLSQSLRARKVTSLSEHRLHRKLERDVRKAQARMAKGRGTMTSVAKRYAVLKEYERQLGGGAVGAGKKVKGKEAAIAQLAGGLLASKGAQKSVGRLRERAARAAIAVAEAPLGKIAGSIKSKQGRGEAEVKSSIEWAGVQNEGGQVGKGATVPARPFMYLASEDVEMLQQIVANRFAAVFGAE